MDGYVKRCLENPAGSRLQQLFVGDVEVDCKGTNTVAFITAQGVPKQYGSNRKELPTHAIGALTQYFAIVSLRNNSLPRIIFKCYSRETQTRLACFPLRDSVDLLEQRLTNLRDGFGRGGIARMRC